MKSLKIRKSPLSKYQYHIDAVTPELISGWAMLKTDIDANPVVEIRSGNSVIWQARAEGERKDLQEAGLGSSAFTIYPDAMALHSDLQSVDIYIDGHKANIDSYPLELKAPDLEQYQCFVDAVDGLHVSGWANYQANPSHRPIVMIKADDVLLGKGQANQLRHDLLEANIGDGHYSFDIELDIGALKSESVACQVWLDGHTMPASDFTITVSSQALIQAKLLSYLDDEFPRFDALLARTAEQLHQQIELHSTDQPASLNDVANVAIQNIAELSSRLTLLEKVLIKSLTKD